MAFDEQMLTLALVLAMPQDDRECTYQVDNDTNATVALVA